MVRRRSDVGLEGDEPGTVTDQECGSRAPLPPPGKEHEQECRWWAVPWSSPGCRGISRRNGGTCAAGWVRWGSSNMCTNQDDQCVGRPARPCPPTPVPLWPCLTHPAVLEPEIAQAEGVGQELLVFGIDQAPCGVEDVLLQLCRVAGKDVSHQARLHQGRQRRQEGGL